MTKDYKQRTIEYYDDHARQYAQSVDDYYSTEQITTFMGLLPDQAKILDVGCGSGRDAHVFSAAGYDVTGLDLSQGMIEFAREKYPDIEFIHADMLQMPFENDIFDGLWAHGVLFHLETIDQVKKALAEFDRVLKPQGILHVLVKLQKDEHKLKEYSDDTGQYSRLYRFFQKDELKSLLEEAGLQVFILETYEENERNPNGRHDVTWLHSLSKKIN